MICPVCGRELRKVGRCLQCSAGHSFDMAKEGYVNLLRTGRKASRPSGDSRESLRGRKRFLEKGYYAFLREWIVEAAGRLCAQPSVILDAGTGTGYYLQGLIERRGGKDRYLAVDVGKEEARECARRNPAADVCVASVFRLPLEPDSTDLVLSVFAPYSAQEFRRVVRKGGYVLAVQPGKRHLQELKEIVYAHPYENPEKGYDLPGFSRVLEEGISREMDLRDSEDIRALWEMTPYAHTTARKDAEKVLSLESLHVTASFYCTAYRKEERG